MAVQLPFVIGFMHTIDTTQLMKLLLDHFGSIFMMQLKDYLRHKVSFEKALKSLRTLITRDNINQFANALKTASETIKKSLDPDEVQHIHLGKNKKPTGCTEPHNKNMALMVEKVT